MPRSGKIWLGILTSLPIVCFLAYIVILFGTLFFTFSEIELGKQDPSYLFVDGFKWMFLSLFLAILTGIGLLIYYIIHVVKNQKFDNTMKLIWILVFLFANGIGTIIYYFVEILPSGRETSD